MFIGTCSFPFGGMEGRYVDVNIDFGEGQLIMLIKQALTYANKSLKALTYANKSLTLKHFQKQEVRLAGNISKEKQAEINRSVRVFVQH